MIKTYYQNDIINRLAAIITYGLSEGYSYTSIEEHIVSSSFINELENNEYDIESKIENIVESTYKITLNKSADISFKSLFLAEAYFRLFIDFNKSFEYIFLYLPLSFMIEKYNIYHEMDFSNLKKDFEYIFEKTPLLKQLSKKREIKLVDISKLTGIKIDTIIKYAQDDKFIYNASFNNIYKLSKLFSVKENIFAKNLEVYLDSSIYIFDERNKDYCNYLGLYFANYFDNRINDSNFEYNRENNFFKLINGIKLIVNHDNVEFGEINKVVDSKTYLVIISSSFFGDTKDFNYLKKADVLEILVLTQNYVYLIKKNKKKEITDTINKSLIIRAKEKTKLVS